MLYKLFLVVGPVVCVRACVCVLSGGGMLNPGIVILSKTGNCKKGTNWLKRWVEVEQNVLRD